MHDRIAAIHGDFVEAVGEVKYNYSCRRHGQMIVIPNKVLPPKFKRAI